MPLVATQEVTRHVSGMEVQDMVRLVPNIVSQLMQRKPKFADQKGSAGQMRAADDTGSPVAMVRILHHHEG